LPCELDTDAGKRVELRRTYNDERVTSAQQLPGQDQVIVLECLRAADARPFFEDRESNMRWVRRSGRTATIPPNQLAG
jgi:DNA-binding GntR family transcriptional regulator